MNLVLFLSDWHIGQHHDRFTPDIAQERIRRIPEQLPRESPEVCHIALGGDLIDGAGIYAYHNTLVRCSPRQQHDMCVAHLRWLLDALLRRWPKTKFELDCVLGNHGRMNKYIHPDSNLDLMIGAAVKALYEKEPRVRIRVHTAQPHAIFKVDRFKFYLTHRTSSHETHLETDARIGKVLRRAVWQHKCDVMLLGHHHRGTAHELDNRLALVVNGALGVSDAFYAEESGFWGIPRQAIIEIPRKGDLTIENVHWLKW